MLLLLKYKSHTLVSVNTVSEILAVWQWNTIQLNKWKRMRLSGSLVGWRRRGKTGRRRGERFRKKKNTHWKCVSVFARQCLSFSLSHVSGSEEETSTGGESEMKSWMRKWLEEDKWKAGVLGQRIALGLRAAKCGNSNSFSQVSASAHYHQHHHHHHR